MVTPDRIATVTLAVLVACMWLVLVSAALRGMS
jgi:hypothetical protein